MTRNQFFAIFYAIMFMGFVNIVVSISITNIIVMMILTCWMVVVAIITGYYSIRVEIDFLNQEKEHGRDNSAQS